MKYCKAASKDAKGIAEVLVACYNIDSNEEGIQVFDEETKKSHNYIIAKDNSKVVGIVTWAVHGLPKHQLCELDRIAVLPEYQGKGIAKSLFDELVKESSQFFKGKNQRLRKLYLLTHSNNEKAKKFYEKLGFKHETTLKQHYYKDMDEHVYSIFFD
jgi:ribosomal protein S18 acetylase RimI-like enzyme